jgi:hypothetical protein
VLKDYVRFQLGEGIEKEVTDFAAEVAAAVGLIPPQENVKAVAAVLLGLAAAFCAKQG